MKKHLKHKFHSHLSKLANIFLNSSKKEENKLIFVFEKNTYDSIVFL
jgi:hypothetical protein